MTLIPWTSIFAALAFALQLASALLRYLNLDFVLAPEVALPPHNMRRGVEYGFHRNTSVLMWAFAGQPTVGGLDIPRVGTPI
jgi:hypothetical protein